jgi:ribonucleoside-diphosphate reductase alpha chain
MREVTMMDSYSTYIHRSRYARYIPELERRETWEETVDRYISFFGSKAPQIPGEVFEECRQAILNLEVMPSMRALMTAGKALEKDNIAGFNCSYLAVDHPRAFDEMMYILMCGTGVGFSVERQYIAHLPEVSEEFHATDTVIGVADSKVGWASSFRELISLLYAGKVPKWDLSAIRPSGAPLKTFGGRASGPAPLEDLFRFCVEVFRGAKGRRLNSLECHDICCKIADIVVVGGVRRSALISLSNLSDDRIRRCKQGEWWMTAPHRALSNNSASYTEKPDFEAFLNEWQEMYKSKAGERGLFSRVASQKQAAKNGRRDATKEFGTNPCSEIILRPAQLCNLSEVVVRPDDTPESLMRKVRIATILGTLQATLTNFRYVRSIWRKNTEEERLLGVSLTGIMDNVLLSGRGNKEDLKSLLERMKLCSVEVNKEYAEMLGINQSTAITCIKPSGTVSQLVDSASGIHPRYSSYYIRRVRADSTDPLCDILKDAGVPWEADVMSKNALVFSFPKKAPEDAVVASEMSAKEQLELWEIYQDHWCEHKPSMTCYYRDTEFLEIGQWVYNKFDKISGISFLPYSDHVYKQAPYEPITKEEYEATAKNFPTQFNWDLKEQRDNTEGVQTLACVAGACEI